MPKLQHALDVTEELSILTNPVNTSTSIFPQDLNTTVYILENTVDLLLEADKMKFEPIINEVKSNLPIFLLLNIASKMNNIINAAIRYIELNLFSLILMTVFSCY